MWILNRKLIVNVGFALALTILTTIGWLSYLDMTSLVMSKEWERNSHVETLELVELVSALYDVESMSRGFVVTGDEKYLEPYYQALLLIELKLTHLQSLTQENPRQKKRLDSIALLIREKLTMVNETIEFRKSNGFQAASQAVMAGRDNRLMDEIRRLVADAHNDDVRILQEREAVDEANTRKVIRLLLAGSILSLVLLCTVFILLNREITRCVRTEEELREHRDHLDRLIQERTAQLEQTRLEAEAANHAKSEFLENMSHEMRTPLTGVMGVIELLLMDARTDVDRHYLEMALTSADALKRLINDIIDFARNATGEMSFRMLPFDLRGFVHSVTDSFALDANRKGLRYLVEIDDRVPETLVGDEGRLRQVLVNLVGNAVKFTEHGEINVKVRTARDSSRPERDVLLFTIRDTGIGITADYLQKVFDKFTQADTSSTKRFGGVGLGLAFSRQIIENMGGTMWVETLHGEGSAFSFTLPLPAERANSMAG